MNASENDSHPRHPDPLLGTMFLLTLLVGLNVIAILRTAPNQMPPAAIRVGVDPNTAPWWELACLPRVGEATARKIVHFRKEATTKPGTAVSPVFSEPADLERVPGIGPRTVLRITRDLRFE